MISRVRGTVLAVELDHAVIEVGGIGIDVRAAPSLLATLRRGEQASVATSLVVREDSLTLFGFADAESRELFELVQTVSGVGPRLALAMLAVLEPETLRQAVADGNTSVLTQVPGVGRKGAERLVVELRDKVGTVAGAATTTGGPAAPAQSTLRPAVLDALVGLGFGQKQAEQAVDGVLADHDTGDESAVLRGALTALGRKR
jgi:Holliday junction DNA helicase RuvA